MRRFVTLIGAVVVLSAAATAPASAGADATGAPLQTAGNDPSQRATAIEYGLIAALYSPGLTPPAVASVLMDLEPGSMG